MRVTVSDGGAFLSVGEGEILVLSDGARLLLNGCGLDALAAIEDRIDRIATQYRESPLLLGLIRGYLGEIGAAYEAICSIPVAFDLDRSIGDQLTIIGKVLGWPREHCVCVIPPVFGYDCEDPNEEWPIVGYCAADPVSSWQDCVTVGLGSVSLQDDELYRRFLRVRRYQFLGLYDIESLGEAAIDMWGETAEVHDAQDRTVVISPGRALTAGERALVPLIFRVLPIAPGVRGLISYTTAPVFGYGTGWRGYAEPGLKLSPPVFGYACAEGWSPDQFQIANYCDAESTWQDCQVFDFRPGHWLCSVDPYPYSCPV